MEPKDAGKGKRKSKSGGGTTPNKKPTVIVTLSRAAAMANAKAYAASTDAKLPVDLGNGIHITRFGKVKGEYVTETSLPMIGYASMWVDGKQIKFISRVIDTGNAPYYSVRAMPQQKTLQSEFPQEVELGSGLTPDAAWQAVIERQQEVVKRQKEHREDGGEGHAEDMEPGDKILLLAAPLGRRWGPERYGFTDIKCLKALEGQKGVENTCYKYVEERTSWDELRAELESEVVDHKNMSTTSAVTGGGGRGSKKHPKLTKEEREKNVISGVLERMMNQLETVEKKREAKEHKEALKKLDKEERRLQRERERENAKQLHEEQKKLAKAAEEEARRKEKEAQKTYPDEELIESASVPPPAPRHIAAGKISSACEPVLLEAWHLLNRFSHILGIHNTADIPSLQQLEASLASSSSSSTTNNSATTSTTTTTKNNASDVWVASTLSAFLISQLFNKVAHDITTSSADISDLNLRPSKTAPPLQINAQTWQEATRRYLAIVADAAACGAKEGASGLIYPTEQLEDWLVVQYLLSGPPQALARGWGALPKGSSQHAWMGPVAISDAAALAAAGPPGGAVSERAPAAVNEAIRVQRCVLQQLATVKGARILCFMGHSAGAAVKWGRSLDLRYVGARVDAGYYAAAQDPLAAFAADVTFVLELHAGAFNRKNSGFYEDTREKHVDVVCELVTEKLNAALVEVAEKGATAYLDEHSPPVAQPRRPHVHSISGGGGGGDASHPKESNDDHDDDASVVEEDEPVTDAVRDLNRPFAPWKGTPCCVCWDDEDDERLLLCSTCGAPYHSYCLDPPLHDIPEGDWPCPGCVTAGTLLPAVAVAPAQFPVGSGAAEIWHMAQLLGSTEYSVWTVGRRTDLLRVLCMLVADSPAVRDSLMAEESTEHDKRSKLRDLKLQKSHLVKEQAQKAAAAAAAAAEKAAAAAGNGGGGGGGGGKGRGDGSDGTSDEDGSEDDDDDDGSPAAPREQVRTSTRRNRGTTGGGTINDAAASEIETLVKRISKLEHELRQMEPQHLRPLGADRHHNRYWHLPAAALGSEGGPGAVVIERYRLEPLIPRAREDALRAVTTTPKWSPVTPMKGGVADWQVGMYKDAQDIAALIAWLNKRGEREKALDVQLRIVYNQCKALQDEMNQAKEENGGGGGPSAAMDVDDPITITTTTSTGALPEQQHQDKSPVELLRDTILDLEKGLVQSARLPLHTAAMEAWRARVADSYTPQEFMSCLISLEQAINPLSLKMYWRSWAMAAPHPDSARTLASVWLRLEALRGAVRYTVKLPAAAGGGGASGGGGRGRKRGGGNDSRVDSEADEDVRAGASKRSRGSSAEVLNDEELARKLHAELNSAHPQARPSRLRQTSAAAAPTTTGAGAGATAVVGGHELRATGPKSYKEPDDDDVVADDEDMDVVDEKEEQSAEAEEEEQQMGDAKEEDYEPGHSE